MGKDAREGCHAYRVHFRFVFRGRLRDMFGPRRVQRCVGLGPPNLQASQNGLESTIAALGMPEIQARKGSPSSPVGLRSASSVPRTACSGNFNGTM